MSEGLLYGVGIGPGDSELITLKALRILKENKVLAVPQTKGEKNTALDIVSNALDISDKEILYINFPMTTDKELLKESHKKSAKLIISYLEKGENVVFISLGDISIYSTFGYINNIIKDMGYKTVMVPGIPSFCAVSSALGISLTDMKKPVHIIPAVHGNIEESIKLDGTKVFMKSGSSAEDLKKAVHENGLVEKAYAVTDCGFDTEKIFYDVNDITDKLGYFTTFIVKD